jgi:hypothetical protein
MRPQTRLFLTLLFCGGFSFSAFSQTDTKDSILINTNDTTQTTPIDSLTTNLNDSVGNVINADIKKKVDKIIEFRSEEEFEQFVTEGIELFNGTKRLENKGPSCLACHVLKYPGISHGGLLSLDLSDSYTNVNQEAGLQVILKTVPGPAMKISYAKNPLTFEETRSLIAVLKKADGVKNLQVTSVNKTFMLFYGIAGFIAILTSMLIIWNRRIKKSVKKDIYSRQIKTV